MAKRLFLAVLFCVAVAAAAWFAADRLSDRAGGTPAQPLADLANPPLGGTVADFSPASPVRPAPAVTFSDGQGKVVELKDFAGKLVLLNFWATWCAPCLEELPSLDRLQGLAGSNRLTVLALSMDRQGLAAVGSYFTKLGIAHLRPYLDDRAAAGRAFGVEGLPTTILIDPDGNILGEMTGPAAWDSPEARRLIDFYLDRLVPP